MAPFKDYAAIAIATYYEGEARYPTGHSVSGYTCKIWETGTWFGNGFQGGVYQSDKEIVVGFCGTNTESSSLGQDLLADVKLALGSLPNQAGSGYKMVKSAAQIAQGRPLSIAGHSLGGGLAQVVAVWCDLPFVTFNSPGMKYQIKLSAFNFMKPVQMKRTLKAKPTESIQGWNFRLKGDPVSKFGHHVGTEVELDYVEGLGGTHGKDSCMLAMAKSGWWSEDVGWYF